MDQYVFSRDVNQAIVDGVLQGYKSYLDERRAKKAELNVSGAYAWVKGNHIDHYVAENVADAGFEWKLDKAGYAWEFLKFDGHLKEDRFVLIIKSVKSLAKSLPTKKKSKENYLSELAAINGIFKMKDSVERTEQLSLFFAAKADSETVQTLVSDYRLFYAVIYEVDEAKMISKIALTLPLQKGQIIEVEDLTPYIASSPVEISAEDLKVVRGETEAEEEIASEFDGYEYIIPAKEIKN
ncbi:spr1630 family ClpXP-sensitive toxin [Listeria newyorkensis]|uniref:Uncharacterized protein n=1 Tax=Listeria newyorkensis TaxID=1497681 RepID=A0A841YUV5_9LIST|nr:hypothetical protein [Listeria newyorkensis]MBC1457254.1 hypothetical protein [Listeria newyorkensis]